MNIQANRYHTQTELRTVTGRCFDLLNPRAADVDKHDIISGMARIPRYNTHLNTGSMTDTAWKVADHLCLSAAIGVLPGMRRTPQEHLDLIFHDLLESYTGDLTFPMKSAIRALGGGEALNQIEIGIDKAIRSRFGIDWEVSESTHIWIKQIDNYALWIEQLSFANLHIDERAAIMVKLPSVIYKAIPVLRPVSERTSYEHLKFLIEGAAADVIKMRPELRQTGLADLAGVAASVGMSLEKKVKSYEENQEFIGPGF